MMMGLRPGREASRKVLLAGVSALALGLALTASGRVQAADCADVASDGVLSSGCTGPLTWSGGSLSITRQGSVSGGNTGIVATTASGTLTNSGSISGANGGVYNAATIGRLTNASSGSIGGITNSGSIGTLNNSGIINGTPSISNGGGGGSGGVVITIVHNPLINNGTIIGNNNGWGGGGSVVETIINNTVTNNGVVSGGTIFLAHSGGSIVALSNNGTLTITSPTITSPTTHSLPTSAPSVALRGDMVVSLVAANTGIGISNGGTIGVLSNSGTINGAVTGILSTGSIGTLTNSGFIGGLSGVFNRGGIDRLDNSGTVSSFIDNGGSIGTLSNLDSGSIRGVSNGGSIGILSNRGVSGEISNGGGLGIGTLLNSGSISSGSAGVWNWGTIGTLTNSGSINATVGGPFGGGDGVFNDGGTIDLLTNSGQISGVGAAIGNISASDRWQAPIGTLINSGTLSGPYGIYNTGSIGTVVNSGAINGSQSGVYNSYGTIGALTNSGTISGANALYSSGSIGVVSNSGVIAGNIYSANDLTIVGGTANGAFGTLTGLLPGAVGTIAATGLTLGFGNLLLNDNINVGYGTVVNSGATLKFTNPSGITINGNYSQTGGGLVFGIASSGSIPALSVTGNATIANSQITVAGNNLASGQSFTLVNAGSGSYSGNSVAITGIGDFGLTASISTINGNDLTVIVGGRGGGYAAQGQAAGGAAADIGSALNSIAASNDTRSVAFQNAVLTPLSTLSPSAQSAAIKQLAPIQIASAAQAASQAAPTASAIEQHTLALNNAGDGANGAAAGSAGHDFGLWGQMLGGGAQRETTAKADGYRSRNFGLVTGLDYQANPDLVVGGAISWVRGWTSSLGNSAGSGSTIDSYQLTGYGLQRWGQTFVDGQISVGYNRFDQRRAIAFLNEKAQANYGGEQYLGKLGIGYDVPLNGEVTVTPLAGLRYLRAVSDSYSETGSSENLTIDRRGVQSLTQDLGGKLSWRLETGWGVLTPEVRLAWVHDYRQGPIASSGIMGGALFTSTVARPNPDGAKLNLATTLETGDDFTLRAEYEGEVRPNYQSHSGLLKATWGF